MAKQRIPERYYWQARSLVTAAYKIHHILQPRTRFHRFLAALRASGR
jgi:hypothetical protein